MKAFEIAIAATVTLVAIYLFVINHQGTTDIINSGATGWAKVINAFQGQRV